MAVSAACRDHEGLRFAYRTHSGETLRRRVEPHGIVHLGRFWYLVAWDRDRDAWRTFRLDRLEGRPTTDRRFNPRPPPPEGFTAHVARGRSVARDHWQAEVVLHGPHDELARRVPPTHGTLEPLGQDRSLLRAGGDWLGALAVNVALLGVDLEVRSPPELAREVRQLAERFTRAADAADHGRERAVSADSPLRAGGAPRGPESSSARTRRS